jgi:hypothetical protein
MSVTQYPASSYLLQRLVLLLAKRIRAEKLHATLTAKKFLGILVLTLSALIAGEFHPGHADAQVMNQTIEQCNKKSTCYQNGQYVEALVGFQGGGSGGVALKRGL